MSKQAQPTERWSRTARRLALVDVEPPMEPRLTSALQALRRRPSRAVQVLPRLRRDLLEAGITAMIFHLRRGGRRRRSTARSRR